MDRKLLTVLCACLVMGILTFLDWRKKQKINKEKPKKNDKFPIELPYELKEKQHEKDNTNE